MATLRDVAREAGVSVATASRAINGLGNVTAPTRAAVMAAVKKLNFVPHSGARSLTRRRTDTVGVILPDLFGEFFSEIIRGIDVFALTPSEHLSANEIAATEMANQGGLFNPQQQFPVTWPSEPTVSLAYLDQWLRAHPDRHQTLEALYETLHAADTVLKNKGQDAALAASLTDWANATDLPCDWQRLGP